MHLTKILEQAYVDFNSSTIDNVNLYGLIFKHMKRQVPTTTYSLKEAKAILFFDKGVICYRTTFRIEQHRVVNNWELDHDFKDVVPYNEDPAKLKQILKLFVEKVLSGKFNEKEFFGYSVNVEDKKIEEKRMNNTLEKMVEVNKASAVNTAKVELGKTANRLVLEKIKPQLPMFVKGYADSPLAELVIGNVVAGLLIQFAPNNKKAQVLSDAMIAAGVQTAVESFDVPGLVKELLANVDITGVTEDD